MRADRRLGPSLVVLMAVYVTGCGPRPAGAPDGSCGADAACPACDAGCPPCDEVLPSDGGGGAADAGSPEDGGSGGDGGAEDDTTPPGTCVEAETLVLSGEVSRHAAAPETVGGTVILGPQGAGGLSWDLRLPEEAAVRLWARVRAPTHSNNSLYAGLRAPGSAGPDIWDVPVTPVLRWQPVAVRGTDGAWWRPGAAFPGRLPAGRHTVFLTGRESQVELDALCLLPPDETPAPRFTPVPVRAATHDARDFGAVGDGVADDTGALQAALDALSPGDALHIPAGRYRITGPLTVRVSEVSVFGDGPATAVFTDFSAASPPEPTSGLFLDGRPPAERVPLLADAGFLARSLGVPADAGFAVGDVIELESDDWGEPHPELVALNRSRNRMQRSRRNLVRVTAVEAEGDGVRLRLDRPLLSEFLTSRSATAGRTRMVRDVVVSDLRFEGTRRHDPDTWEGRDLNANVSLIHAEWCDRCSFVNLELAFFRRRGMFFDRTVDDQVVGCHFDEATDWDGDSHGYGIDPWHSQHLVARDNLFTGVMRHPLLISWSGREFFFFRNRIVRPVLHHPWKSVNVDVHGEDAYGNLIEGNWIVRGSTGVVIGGGGDSHGNDGPWNVVRGNVIQEVSGQAVTVADRSHDQVIEGNVVLSPGGIGLYTAYLTERTYVWGNFVRNPGAAAIKSENNADASIIGNEILGASTAVSAVDATGYEIRENVLNGGGVYESSPGSGTVVDNR